MWYICTIEYLLSHTEDWNLRIGANVNGPRWYYATRNVRETQISYYFANKWNLKIKSTNKTETESKNVENKRGCPKGGGGGWAK